MTHVLVMAKAPAPSRVKTRLCPPATPAQAAALAEAALADTLEAVVGCRADRRVIALDGAPGPWLPPGFDLIVQQGRTFADRLANAWTAVGEDGFQIGMDTPQLASADLDHALTRLDRSGVDAVLGPALDGGWWGIGLREPVDVFRGVPTSTSTTGARQLRRLERLGLRVESLPPMRDVDTFADAIAVAALVPRSRFGAALSDVRAAA